jgi:hypothetical protein
MRSRTVTAVAGVVGSLLVSAVLWLYFETAVFLLFVPFRPLLRGRRDGEPVEETVRECPVCGFRTTETSYDYCPRDGTRLE